MNTIEHPELHRIQLIGYPNAEYLEWEQRLAEEEIVEGDWPDGLTHGEWQKEKRSLGKVNA